MLQHWGSLLITATWENKGKYHDVAYLRYEVYMQIHEVITLGDFSPI